MRLCQALSEISRHPLKYPPKLILHGSLESCHSTQEPFKSSKYWLNLQHKMSSSQLPVRNFLWDDRLQPLLENRTGALLSPKPWRCSFIGIFEALQGIWGNVESLPWSMYKIAKSWQQCCGGAQSSIVPCFKLSSQMSIFLYSY